MKLSVLVLLLMVLLQGRGSILKGQVQNHIDLIKMEKESGFRTVFPKDYNISHHYNEKLLCDTDPCCVLRAALVLAESWHKLLIQLWETNEKHSTVKDMHETLQGISKQRFRTNPDMASLPSVSSTPEDLLGLTDTVLSQWLKKSSDGALTDNLTCEFSTSDNSLEKEESYDKMVEDENTSTPASCSPQSDRHLSVRVTRSGCTPSARLAAPLLLAACYFSCLTEC